MLPNMAAKFHVAAIFVVGLQLICPSAASPHHSDIDDFEDDHRGYEFIYHDHKADEDSERHLSDNKPLGIFPSPRYAVEAFIRKIIRDDEKEKVHKSSLKEVAREFHDMAANKKCKG